MVYLTASVQNGGSAHMKVIGAGYARTGTLSLKAALEMLGVGPCLHPLAGEPAAASVIGPERDAEHWRSSLAQWRATLGWIGACHYPELMEAFPEAIVVLSVRDPDAWYRSYASCVRHARELGLSGEPADGAASDTLLLRDERGGLMDGRALERARALERYQRHNDAVMSTVPSERLLVWDVAEGWGPLCERLGVAAPGVSFPHLNTERAFGARLAGAATPAPLGSTPRLRRICTDDSARSFDQSEVLERLGLAGDAFAERIFGRSGVRTRHLELLEGSPADSLQGRTPVAEDQLFAHAVRAVDALGIDPREIGVVVSASLYSLAGPTLAHRMIEHYAMDPQTDKYHVVGVGCASAVPLVRLTAQALSAHPGRQGLIIAAESMSGLLTEARDDDARAKIVGAAIFGDGCAAALVEAGGDGPGPSVVASSVHQIPGTLGAVRMELSDFDGYLHLDRELPDIAGAHVGAIVDGFLEPLGLTRYAIDHWVVHPGGRRIIECIQAGLGLSEEQVRVSYDTLAAHGNVGTPSIFYVLDETIRRREPAPGDRGLVVTIGPGVTVGLMLLVW